MVAMAKSTRATPAGTILADQTSEPASPPAWIKPQLAALAEKAPDGSDWLHKIKFDGYRMHARLDAGRAQILTRRGNDWTENFAACALMVRRHSTLSRTRLIPVRDRWSSSSSTYCTWMARTYCFAAGGPQDPVSISAA